MANSKPQAPAKAQAPAPDADAPETNAKAPKVNAEAALALAKENAGGYTLIPAKKVKGNHQVEPVLVNGKPLVEGDMAVVKAKVKA